MCSSTHDSLALTHWNALQHAADELGLASSHADAIVDHIAQHVRDSLRDGVTASRALARACDEFLDVIDELDAPDVTSALAPSAAEAGAGHELACAIVAVEVARRVAIPARLVLLPDRVLVVARDGGTWGALLPRMGEMTWVCMPAALFATDDAALCCPHDAVRMTLQLAAPKLDSELLPAAMHLIDEVTTAA